MPKIGKKKFIDKNVYEKALERFHHIYNTFDYVDISFSGGKDSTAMLNCAIEVARERGELPVHVTFWDEEAIHPTTIKYMYRINKRDEIDLKWYALPIKLRNGCSFRQPWWYAFNPDKKDLWVRKPPDFAIKEHPNFRWGMRHEDFSLQRFHPMEKYGDVASCLGLRATESVRRYNGVATRKVENYISGNHAVKYKNQNINVSVAKPIYDWTAEDVWILINKKGYDYNKTYDLFNKTKYYNNFHGQRVCQPFGEFNLGTLLDLYEQIWPDMFERMLNRVDGVHTANKYGASAMYGTKDKPEGLTWKKYTKTVLKNYPNVEFKNTTKENLNGVIEHHYRQTNDLIPDDKAHMLTGLSWKLMARSVVRGDHHNKLQGQVKTKSTQRLKQAEISWVDALLKYGKPKWIKWCRDNNKIKEWMQKHKDGKW